ncbi:MAG: hypothetical protein WA110_00690 [Anaerolineaceae bacterium]
MKKYLLKIGLVYLIIAVVVVLILAGVGYSAKGREGALNAAAFGLLLDLMALPFMGILIAARFWSGYAGRYGEWYYKKETEGDPNDRSKQQDKW